jgi:hypothetical protein
MWFSLVDSVEKVEMWFFNENITSNLHNRYKSAEWKTQKICLTTQRHAALVKILADF